MELFALLFFMLPAFFIAFLIQLSCNGSEHNVLRHGSLFYALLLFVLGVFGLVGFLIDPVEGYLGVGLFVIGLTGAAASLIGYGLARLIHKIRTE